MGAADPICPVIALDPDWWNESDVVWVQRWGAIYYWNRESRKFETAEGPLLPEGWCDGSR
jgi:hypothetical protein